MEKLLKLLRKFEEEEYVDGKQLYDRGPQGDYIYCRDKLHKEREFTVREAEAIMISDWYGFIKWLVENEKIDTDKIEEKSEYTFIKNGGGEHIIEDVLMLLSISDTPIEDLISYLK